MLPIDCIPYRNTGMCQVMHDEAVTTYTAIINQMTLGLDFLKRHLNVRPRIGWHIGEFVILILS